MRRKARRRSATLIQFERDDLYIMLFALYALSVSVGAFFL